MSTQRILISTDKDGLVKLQNNINHTSDVLSRLAYYLKDNLNYILTMEIAQDVVSNAGVSTLERYHQEQSKKFDKSGINGKVKENMLRVISEDLQTDLQHFQRDFSHKGFNSYDPLAALPYLSINSEGLPYIADVDAERMEERFKMYAETPAQMELYNAHKKAVDALNDLRNVTDKVFPTTYFTSPIAFFSTFFEMDAQERVSQKVLNYNLI